MTLSAFHCVVFPPHHHHIYRCHHYPSTYQPARHSALHTGVLLVSAHRHFTIAKGNTLHQCHSEENCNAVTSWRIARPT